MISRSELYNVSKFAEDVAFPGKDYAIKTMDNLIDAFNMYVEIFRNTEFNLGFSNGKNIRYRILDKNLSHLLGINNKNLLSESMRYTLENVLGITSCDGRSSFEILRRILERADEVIKNDSNEKNYKILNYYRVMLKSLIFLGLPFFDTFDFGCINFNKDAFDYNNMYNFSPESTMYLFTMKNEVLTPFFMLGLRYDEREGLYIPETTLAPERFERYLGDQELLIPTHIVANYNNHFTKLFATNEDKLKLLDLYKYIINLYQTNTSINILADYENVLNNNPKINRKF